jgi:hypothetical protein
MIIGNDIQSLVHLFDERQVSLYHACQLLDFQSYLDLGGIPSRALLENRQSTFTPFQTDDTDRENNVWDKVFVNLIDFGENFARGANNVPNPYGPVLFQIRPSALLEASDIAVCLWSAGAKGFNREREALNTIEDVNRLFLNPSNAPFPESTYVKFRGQLAREFGKQRAQDPEISCTVRNEVLSAKYVTVIWVDPYVVNNRALLDWVSEIKKRYRAQFHVRQRNCRDNSRISLYNEIAERIGEQIPSLHALGQDETCSQLLRNWARQILTSNLEWQFRRYAEYLRDGTLIAMRTAVMPTGH